MELAGTMWTQIIKLKFIDFNILCLWWDNLKALRSHPTLSLEVNFKIKKPLKIATLLYASFTTKDEW